ncbi:hypothetical protein Cni_G03354 [Canna indica]|uniref:BZIP transcription factor n=1 Tax=Canna indica TaxID=4628 RepID=A0AAQ3JTC3_9LILI|nr:hypothetical protein Cni_G03354 [Canna indica]
MGCGSSKPEEEAAVLLCRHRSQLLADAIRYRYALADAHASYALSLASVGSALQGFLHGARGLPPASPVLPLPTQRKGDPLPPLTPSPPPPTAAAAAAVSVPSAAVRGHSHSHSGSHIHFHPSGSESDDDSPLHSGGDSPIHHLASDEPPVGKTYVNFNYARNRPAESSVAYEQQPPGSESVRFGNVDEPTSAAYPYYGDQYPPQSSSFYPPYPSDQYMNYGGGMGGGFFGSSSPPPNIPLPAAAAGGSSTPQEAPPPPSPKASTWDFLNPFFESYDNYYPPYTPSRSSRELREEEGIPDLEDEEQEVVKEAYGDSKFVASTSAAAKGEHAGKFAMGLKDGAINGEDPHRKSRSVEAVSNSEHEVHIVEKSVINEPAERRSAGFAVSRSYLNDAEVVQEIKTQFDRVFESAEQVSKMLEVGKLLYQQKASVYKAVSVEMICGLAPFSISNNEDPLVYEEDKAMDCGNLSSTLQKLYNWEKKLLEEVMEEEKMRVLYERKREHLRHLIERGSEAEKIEAVENKIKKLSTKIRIAIQVVGTISSKISQLRDDELWPEVRELIQGFMGMWRVMSECHHIQSQAISEAKNLDSILSGVKLTDAHMDAVKQLQLVMTDWITNFSNWVFAQRSYVKSLNGWLVKGIHYVPEVTDDGEVPFSPGRLGAPPVFVICNSWSQSMDRVSERDVVEAAQVFIDSVVSIWQQHKLEQQQRLLANKDMDNKLRPLEREEQEILKQKQKLMLISSENGISIPEHVHQDSTVHSLQSSLRKMFEAVESYAANTMNAYVALHSLSEEEKQKFTRENARVS